VHYSEALCRMTIVDADYVASVLNRDDTGSDQRVDVKTLALIRIAALAATASSAHSFAAEVDLAIRSGASPDEVVGVLTGIAPIIGSATLAMAAPALALALGFDTEQALESTGSASSGADESEFDGPGDRSAP
jgi:4-carboxymuconolactone decarboxylase